MRKNAKAPINEYHPYRSKKCQTKKLQINASIKKNFLIAFLIFFVVD
jgi:hypothetical protein